MQFTNNSFIINDSKFDTTDYIFSHDFKYLEDHLKSLKNEIDRNDPKGIVMSYHFLVSSTPEYLFPIVSDFGIIKKAEEYMFNISSNNFEYRLFPKLLEPLRSSRYNSGLFRDPSVNQACKFLLSDYKCSITYKGLEFTTVDDAFLYQKEQLKNINDTHDNANYQIMYEIVMQKFMQNHDLMFRLLNTKNNIFISFVGKDDFKPKKYISFAKYCKIINNVRNKILEDLFKKYFNLDTNS